jgi:hypothetical protein
VLISWLEKCMYLVIGNGRRAMRIHEDPFGFSSFAAELELDIFLLIFSGVGRDLFSTVDLETTLSLPPLFLDDDPLPAPNHFSRFLVMATKQERKIEERDVYLLMRNALVWF